MYGKTTASVMALCAALITAQGASAYLEIVENSFESSTTEVRIPAADDAALALRHCPDCPTVTLRITPETRYFLDEQQVTQAEFRQAAARGRSGMTVYFAPESKNVTRIVMHAS